jgi:GMP synthase (glutamine-hydrolysing)
VSTEHEAPPGRGAGPRLLVVEHEADCPPGWMGEWLSAAGAHLDVRRPYRGDTLPATLDDHDGMVVLGGSMGPDDDAAYPWLGGVKDLIRGAARDATPVLGICLGHQLAAVALGGEVHRNPLGKQIGTPPIGWLRAAAQDRLLGALTTARIGVQWNQDVVHEIPAGARVLARTERMEIQAAWFGCRVWGVQWHPEAGADIVRRWVEGNPDGARETGLDLPAALGEIEAAEAELRTAWQPLAAGFAKLCRRSPGEGAVVKGQW